ncbi:hypothetical protein F5Y14DRAFT_437896 [Nemania sp. NC0429]|nr:hypothetical protein F5Y14DRAFT_437896 [Nemania sp. NC0429]
MEQYFRLVAPQAHSALSWDRNLERIIFEDMDYLVRLLVVPVRPQHGSSPNFSMNSINTIDREKREAKRNRDDSDAHANSSRPHKQINVHGPNDKVVSNAVSTLSSLPPELHLLIFSFIEDIYDVISFGITNQYFSSIGREYLDDYIISQFGQWAGTNVVSWGAGIEPNDYPPGLFSTEEVEILRQYDYECSEGCPEEEFWPPEPFTLWHMLCPGKCMEIESPKSLFDLVNGLRIGCSIRGMLTDPGYHSIMPRYNVKDDLDEAYFPSNQQWILRNLTTKETVHSNAIALSPDYIEGPNIQFLGFGHVVMSRICWSSSPPYPWRGKPDIMRGVWAGHRFDITTLSKHEAETRGEEWRDVSDTVTKEIASIWEAAHGPDWREVITQKQ